VKPIFKPALLAMTTMVLPFVAAGVVLSASTVTAAYAKNNGNNGNKGGQSQNGNAGAGNSASAPGQAKKLAAQPASMTVTDPTTETLSHGAIASRLKGLNAAHASLTAMAHANPNSRVGRIATFREGLITYNADQAAYEAALLQYDADNAAANQALADALAAQDAVTAAYLASLTTLLGGTPEDPASALAALQALPDGATVEEIATFIADTYGIDPTTIDPALLDSLAGVTTSDSQVLDQAILDQLAAAEAERLALEEQQAAIEAEKLALDQALIDAAAPNAPPAEGTPEYDAFIQMLRLQAGLLFTADATTTAEPDPALPVE
jgi:hypothetical protein